ncbi:hypothetical protein [Archaeoglobus profundus]|uniref:Uncharacterized protein n=1 Tax=Archaeoglobus profundus (strain DSM 5631 / JCM 9629 / NBRC 100127 / Av18) TaxID=572546 RepID=D2RHU6_ARCPA|nr:hypothetical protein [Archaeoglobus profundus]ADB57871.1 hypothetical protein Arcpr_0808 [Archaeoglobus profundus DSM 5631]
MLSRIYQILSILDDPSLIFIGVFRIDGDPILVRCKDKIILLKIVDWLDGHIKASLDMIVAEELGEIGTKFKDLFVRLVPLSKTLVLVMIANEEMSLYKFEMDISSLRSALS